MNENENFELSDEERKEYEDQIKEAMNNSDDPDHEFISNIGRNPNAHASGGIIHIGSMGGSQTMNPEDLLAMMFGARMPKYREIPILNGYWLLRIVDFVSYDNDENATFFLEVIPNIKVKNKMKGIDLVEIMEMFQHNHFINFVVSMISPARIWDLKNIEYMIHENQKDNYSVLEIMVVGTVIDPPDWICNSDSNDFDYYKETQFITEKIDAPVMKHLVKRRHLYEPLIVYDITAAFTSFSNCNFQSANIDFANMFLRLIQPDINDAICSFYGYNKDLLKWATYHEESLHCFFAIEFSKKMIKVTIYCSPAACPLGSGYIYPFSYLGNNEYSIGADRMDQKQILPATERYSTVNNFLMNIRRSNITQVFNVGYYLEGSHFEEGSAIKLKSDSYLFSLESILKGITQRNQGIKDNIIPCTVIRSSKYSNIGDIQYWKFKCGARNFEMDDGSTMTLYGFIDIDYQFLDEFKCNTGSGFIKFLYKNDNLGETLDLPVEIKKKPKLLEMFLPLDVSANSKYFRIGVCQIVKKSGEIFYEEK